MTPTVHIHFENGADSCQQPNLFLFFGCCCASLSLSLVLEFFRSTHSPSPPKKLPFPLSPLYVTVVQKNEISECCRCSVVSQTHILSLTIATNTKMSSAEKIATLEAEREQYKRDLASATTEARKDLLLALITACTNRLTALEAPATAPPAGNYFSSCFCPNCFSLKILLSPRLSFYNSP